MYEDMSNARRRARNQGYFAFDLPPENWTSENVSSLGI